MSTRKLIITWVSRLLIAFLAFSMLAVLAPQTASAAPLSAKTKCGTPYIVKQGNTLSSIGKKFDISAYSIVEENSLKSPYTIYVGQRLCIPENNKNGSLSSKYANAQAAYFTAWFWTDGIYVQPFNYPKTTTWVKGDNPGDKIKNFIKIGRLNTKNTGNNRVHFTLPSDLRKSTSLTVCLKDITTDYNQCVFIPPKK
jgi:LysM repeat protein